MKPEDRVVKLPEDDQHAIRAMLYWMYMDKLGFSEGQIEGVDYTSTAEEVCDSIWVLLVKIYILGEKYDVPRLRNHTIDVIISLNFGVPLPIYPGIIPYVYENTSSSNDRLRKYLITAFTFECGGNSVSTFKEVLCQDFLIELAAQMLLDTESDTELEGPYYQFCERFHIHTEGTEVCKEMHDFDEVEDDFGS